MMKNPLLNDPQVTWDMYQPRYQALLDRDVAPDEIEGFLLEWSDLEIELSHIGSVRYLNAHLDTQDEAAKASKASYHADIQPHKDRMDAALRKKLLSMDQSHLPEDAVRMVRRFQADDRLFSEENIPLLQKMTELEQEYSQLSASLRLDFRGEKLPFPRIKPFLTNPDRATREEAWMALQKADLEMAPRLDDLFLRQLQVRRQLARNAGYPDFRAYMWDGYHRFDYTPEDCLQFHQTVKEEVVPFARELLEQHRQGLGVDELRPWDFIWYAQTDPQNRPPLQPFQTTDELIEKTEQVFFKLHPRMGELFGFFRENQAMDLGARENKLSQAYCIRLPAHKMPFVFQSAVGTAADVLTTLHESGHAFHGRISMLSQRFIWNWSASKEFVEVPSMGMECLPLDHLSPFYTPEELQRVKTSAALRMVHGLPWMCFLDAFQHWLYSETPEDVTIDMLDQKARELVVQFQPTPSWEGFETYRGKAWHYFHIFNVPFYYIEYAFSGLGALQLWKNNQQDPQKTIEQYFAALEAGNSRSVPELYELCGLSFRFDRETVRNVMHFVREQLKETPQP